MNLLSIRKAAKEAGVRVVWRGSGNASHIHFYFPSGRRIVVWYPDDGRGGDSHIRELEEVHAGIESGELA